MATSACAVNYTTVKEFVDAGNLENIALPSIYITRSPGSATDEIVVDEEIPAIDFYLLKSGNPDERNRTSQDIGRACKQWGCFMLVNHGLPVNLQTATMEAFDEFFNLTVEEKREYMDGKLLEPIRCGTSYESTEGVQYWRDYVRMFVHPTFSCPSKPPNFRMVCEELARYSREITAELLRAICASVDLPENCIEEALQMELCTQAIVGNLYPRCPQPELALGIPSHSDPSLLSILMQNCSLPSLQMLHNDTWVPVHLNPSSLVVIVGDLLELVSNGMFKSAVHRAMLSKETARISVVFVNGPSFETVVGPLPQLAEEAAFRSVSFQEYIVLRNENHFGKNVMDRLRL
ncbi:hypothetical protein HPP92_002055 [Vanilla planifolia]|uniref:Fe2OG dioxygenase domain-containing protein n=1 Tax=Vanilla planifolia TaxID=51239 RepID=A0A835VM53_VANPL|nr:hypothetical protein HPP92_002055 [Vanilla planifolia]